MGGAEKYKLFTIPPLGDRANSLFLIYFKTNLISKQNKIKNIKYKLYK